MKENKSQKNLYLSSLFHSNKNKLPSFHGICLSFSTEQTVKGRNKQGDMGHWSPMETRDTQKYKPVGNQLSLAGKYQGNQTAH